MVSSTKSPSFFSFLVTITSCFDIVSKKYLNRICQLENYYFILFLEATDFSLLYIIQFF